MIDDVGYGAIAALVFAQSAGLPVPGGTALIAAGALAAHGGLSLPVAALVGVAATIAGANAGFASGRRYGEAILTRKGRWERQRAEVHRVGQALMDRWGRLALLASSGRCARSRRAPLARGRDRSGSSVRHEP